jgi:diguanylate cyclase (GGDEF)-like protein
MGERNDIQPQSETGDTGHSGLRHLFRRRADSYAGADLLMMKRAALGLWVLGSLCTAALLPVAPATQAIGTNGRFVAIALGVVAVTCAARLRLMPDRVGVNELLAMSYASLVSVALFEWLAGGDNTPYNHLYLLPVVFTAMVHPPRRAATFLLFFIGVAGLRFSYADWDAQEVGDVALQVFTTAGLAFLGCVVMDGVRAQRLSLREEGDVARELAATDALTGLGNRRSLVEDLARRTAEATAERPLVMTLFDLDGFKAYNDAYGHPAGDTLLARLGQRLGEAAETVGGAAYRMGGDEFCVLASPGAGSDDAVAHSCLEALTEAGEGFSITASHGTVVIPDEHSDPESALRAADQRMYADKSVGRSSAARQSADVLLRLLSERSLNAGRRVDDAMWLCDSVARRLGLSDPDRETAVQATALRSIGKTAIPDTILGKPDSLNEDEWAFMRGHTLIGERILGAAPALAAVARLVRSMHERVDGSGYPDALTGDEIPLGSRIVAVCDAFAAMTSERPYRTAMSRESALAELVRCAGSQFDPRVVAAFEHAVHTVRDSTAAARV